MNYNTLDNIQLIGRVSANGIAAETFHVTNNDKHNLEANGFNGNEEYFRLISTSTTLTSHEDGVTTTVTYTSNELRVRYQGGYYFHKVHNPLKLAVFADFYQKVIGNEVSFGEESQSEGEEQGEE